MAREIVPEWHSERFFNNHKKEIDEKGLVMEWHTTKLVMITTLNYIRTKGYKCEWIEKREGLFLIKISKP